MTTAFTLVKLQKTGLALIVVVLSALRQPSGKRSLFFQNIVHDRWGIARKLACYNEWLVTTTGYV